MTGSHGSSSSARFRPGVLALLAMAVLSVASPARADDLVFETEADRIAFETWGTSGARQAWLYMVDALMVPCFQNQHETCQKNMVAALQSVPDTIREARVRVGQRTERVLFAVRNNQFLYQTAFSLRILVSIVEQGGGCAEWEARAAALTGVRTGALKRLHAEAASEIGNRKLPEAKELAWVDGRSGKVPWVVG